MSTRLAQFDARRLTRILGLCIFLFWLATGSAVAEPAINLFGPQMFEKGADSPDIIQKSFAAPPDIQELRVLVKNGPGGKEGVKSVRVILNDVVAFTTADFHSSKARASKDRIRSLPTNQLQVILRGGGEGGAISVQVMGILPSDPGKKLGK